MELTNIQVIRELMAKHHFAATKNFGQNFIINDSICPQMAEVAECDDIGVLEIGPGIGVLTKELSKRAHKVVSLEIDDKLIPVLKETLMDCENVTIIHQDVLETDLPALLEEQFGKMPVCVCANLPYNITSPIITKLLDPSIQFRKITVMVQKEAGQRFCSPPGTRLCGAISTLIWYYANPKKCFDVGKGCFFPSPEVDSVVISLVPNENKVTVCHPEFLFKISKAAFSLRRKTLSNSLSNSLKRDKSFINNVLEKSNIDPQTRAEQLTLEQLALLADAFEAEDPSLL